MLLPASAGLFVCRFLSKASLISQLAATYKFSDYSVAVGTTYFQRLAARDPAMRYYALQSAEFSQHLTGVPADAGRDSLWRSVGYGHTFRLTHDGWLTLVSHWLRRSSSTCLCRSYCSLFCLAQLLADPGTSNLPPVTCPGGCSCCLLLCMLLHSRVPPAANSLRADLFQQVGGKHASASRPAQHCL